MKTRPAAEDAKDLRLRAAGVFVLLLLMLGILLPFWMEYKSLASPTAPRAAPGTRVKAYDSRKQYFCPACGGTISVPYWSDGDARTRDPRPPLTLERLAASTWEPPFPSTATPRPHQSSNGPVIGKE